MNSDLHLAGRQILLVGFYLILTSVVVGGAVSQVVADEQPDRIAKFLSLNCTGCHYSGSKEGDLDLDSLSLKLNDPDNFHIWERVFDRVHAGEMPPDETLDDEETSPFLTSLYDVLRKSDADRIASMGRVPARRLTGAQYERNVCNLLAIDVPLNDYLPVDSLTNGFDTVSKSQQDGSLLDHTMLLLTSNLGNASAHDTKNMPVVVAGGGFKHGQYLAFDRVNNYPLPNLYTSMLQRLGLEIDAFASATGTMRGLEMS